MDNMQKSERVIAKILDLAMMQAIQGWQLSFKDLELGGDYEPFFFQSIQWLEAEDIIRVTEYRRLTAGGGSVINPILTSHGMNILGHRVKLGKETTLMSDAVKQVSSGEKSFSQIGDFFGGFLGGFTKSVGS